MGSKIKQILRSHDPRTEADLLLAAKTAFQSISAADCSGFFFWRPTRYMINGSVLIGMEVFVEPRVRRRSQLVCLTRTDFSHSA